MKLFIATAAFVVLTAGPVYADCPYPAPPDKIPDGNTASLSEMVAVKKQVSDYDAAIGVYLDCIKQEHEDAVAKGGDKLTDKQKQDLDHMGTSGTTPRSRSCKASPTASTNRFGSTRRKT